MNACAAGGEMLLLDGLHERAALSAVVYASVCFTVFRFVLERFWSRLSMLNASI